LSNPGVVSEKTIAKVQAAVDDLIKNRLMLREDADRTLEKARNEARVNP